MTSNSSGARRASPIARKRPDIEHLRGHAFEPGKHTWAPDDALLYALAVGAGQDDGLEDLAFTTENSHGVDQAVLPSFPVVFPTRIDLAALGISPETVVHAEQSLEVFREIPVSGTAVVRPQIEEVYDKGSGALIVIETLIGADDGLLASLRSGVFVRGVGGFGGQRGPESSWEVPQTRPTHEVTFRVAPNQALVYRLCGDRNPLHSDPWFAERAGFNVPILHGLCTYGFAARALLKAVASNDPNQFGRMSCRFTKPVFPGTQLQIPIWETGSDVRFRVISDGDIVVDRGTFTRRESDEIP